MATSPSTRKPRPRRVVEPTDEDTVIYDPGTTVDDEAVEGRVVDDGSDTRQPLPGKNPTRPERTSRPSTRSGRAAYSRKQPQDHKASQASLAAQRREAQADDAEDGTEQVAFEYEGLEFVFDPADMNIRFQRLCERGAPVAALEHLFGSDVIDQIETWPFDDIQELVNRASRAAGLGNS